MLGVSVDPEAERDFVALIGSLTNFVQNERVRAYNEGYDAAAAEASIVKLHMPPRPEVGMTMEIDGERFEIVEVTWTGGMIRVVLSKVV